MYPGFSRRRFLLLFLLLVTGLTCSASADPVPFSLPVNVSDTWLEYSLDIKDVRVVEDPEKIFSPEDILSLPPESLHQVESLYFGYTSSAYWLLFDMEFSGEGRIFITEHYGLDRFEVWTIHPDSDGPVLQGITGWRHSDTEMKPASRYAVSTVPIPASPGGLYRVLLKIESTTSLAPVLSFMERIPLCGVQDESVWFRVLQWGLPA